MDIVSGRVCTQQDTDIAAIIDVRQKVDNIQKEVTSLKNEFNACRRDLRITNKNLLQVLEFLHNLAPKLQSESTAVKDAFVKEQQTMSVNVPDAKIPRKRVCNAGAVELVENYEVANVMAPPTNMPQKFINNRAEIKRKTDSIENDGPPKKVPKKIVDSPPEHKDFVFSQLPQPTSRIDLRLSYERSERKVTQEMIKGLHPAINKDVRVLVAKYVSFNIRESLSDKDVYNNLRQKMAIYLDDFIGDNILTRKARNEHPEIEVYAASLRKGKVVIFGKCRKCRTYYVADPNIKHNKTKCICKPQSFQRNWFITTSKYCCDTNWTYGIFSVSSQELIFANLTVIKQWMNDPCVDKQNEANIYGDKLGFRIVRLHPFTKMNQSVVHKIDWEIYVECGSQHVTGPLLFNSFKRKGAIGCAICWGTFRSTYSNAYKTTDGACSARRPKDVVQHRDKNDNERVTVQLIRGRTAVMAPYVQVGIVDDMDKRCFFDNGDSWLLGDDIVHPLWLGATVWHTVDAINLTRKIYYEMKCEFTMYKLLHRLPTVISVLLVFGATLQIALSMGCRYTFAYFECNLLPEQETQMKQIECGDIDCDISKELAVCVIGAKLEDYRTLGFRIGRELTDSGSFGKSVHVQILNVGVKIVHRNKGYVQVYGNGVLTIIVGFVEKLIYSINRLEFANIDI